MDVVFKRMVLTVLFLASIFIFIKVIWLDDIYEFFDWGSEIGEIFFQLSLAYVGGYIFYWIASYETRESEKQRNRIVNKIKLERLIRSIEYFILLYIAYTGNRDKFSKNEDLLAIDIANARLKITIGDENPLIKISDNKQDLLEQRPFIYFEYLSTHADYIREFLNKCIDSYLMMPLDLIKVIEEFNSEFKIDMLLKTFKNRNDFIITRTFAKKSSRLSALQNQDLNENVAALRKGLVVFRDYFKNEFNNNYSVNIDYIVYLKQHELMLLKKENGELIPLD